ncbi:hypothetical protein Y032_0072g667 [Ancylostoma ceylanicum]|uniref:Uncharacterized protein n=1 Tax=Ancylostoma ceylanicum TaxID=53326 RepID=A0A016TXJ2_9BILA|nr:hypothetical protein Y032_0072g667 [Ancylostoma ceylanicum]
MLEIITSTRYGTIDFVDRSHTCKLRMNYVLRIVVTLGKSGDNLEKLLCPASLAFRNLFEKKIQVVDGYRSTQVVFIFISTYGRKYISIPEKQTPKQIQSWITVEAVKYRHQHPTCCCQGCPEDVKTTHSGEEG